MNEYRVIVTTPKYPDGVSYPGTGCPLYTREQAIEVLQKMVANGRPSDWEHEYGAYAEGPSERFVLADVTCPH